MGEQQKAKTEAEPWAKLTSLEDPSVTHLIRDDICLIGRGSDCTVTLQDKR